MNFICILLAVLSIWDYPSRQAQHNQLRQRFVVAVKEGDTTTMEETSRKGTELLPDDPTWAYNLACSLCWYEGREKEALDMLEKAIDLGFRDVRAIKNDNDLRRISSNPRFSELVKKASSLSSVPVTKGPMASEEKEVVAGTVAVVGAKNLMWDFDAGIFNARIKLKSFASLGNTGDLYMNRDVGHSRPKLSLFPGITEVKFDMEGVQRNMASGIPNVCFPYPLFGNCSQAFVAGPFWRSMPRAIASVNLPSLLAMQKLYLSNQIWFFPSNVDTPPLGKHGDVFHSLVPFFVTTAGRSWSDIPYLHAAMLASRSLPRDTKQVAVQRSLFAPTIITLLKKSLKDVVTEDDYISSKAHPTAMPPGGIDTNKLVEIASSLKPAAIPPLVTVTAESVSEITDTGRSELLYATPFAWSFVLNAPERKRVFVLKAKGAEKMRFARTHGTEAQAKVVPIGRDGAVIELDAAKINPSNRVDIAVFGRNPKTGWGAPAFVSFARMDERAAYSDPVLTPRPAERQERK